MGFFDNLPGGFVPGGGVPGFETEEQRRKRLLWEANQQSVGAGVQEQQRQQQEAAYPTIVRQPRDQQPAVPPPRESGGPVPQNTGIPDDPKEAQAVAAGAKKIAELYSLMTGGRVLLPDVHLALALSGKSMADIGRMLQVNPEGVAQDVVPGARRTGKENTDEYGYVIRDPATFGTDFGPWQNDFQLMHPNEMPTLGEVLGGVPDAMRSPPMPPRWPAGSLPKASEGIIPLYNPSDATVRPRPNPNEARPPQNSGPPKNMIASTGMAWLRLVKDALLSKGIAEVDINNLALNPNIIQNFARAAGVELPPPPVTPGTSAQQQVAEAVRKTAGQLGEAGVAIAAPMKAAVAQPGIIEDIGSLGLPGIAGVNIGNTLNAVGGVVKGVASGVADFLSAGPDAKSAILDQRQQADFTAPPSGTYPATPEGASQWIRDNPQTPTPDWVNQQFPPSDPRYRDLTQAQWIAAHEADNPLSPRNTIQGRMATVIEAQKQQDQSIVEITGMISQLDTRQQQYNDLQAQGITVPGWDQAQVNKVKNDLVDALGNVQIADAAGKVFAGLLTTIPDATLRARDQLEAPIIQYWQNKVLNTGINEQRNRVPLTVPEVVAALEKQGTSEVSELSGIRMLRPGEPNVGPAGVFIAYGGYPQTAEEQLRTQEYWSKMPNVPANTADIWTEAASFTAADIGMLQQQLIAYGYPIGLTEKLDSYTKLAWLDWMMGNAKSTLALSDDPEARKRASDFGAQWANEVTTLFTGDPSMKFLGTFEQGQPLDQRVSILSHYENFDKTAAAIKAATDSGNWDSVFPEIGQARFDATVRREMFMRDVKMRSPQELPETVIGNWGKMFGADALPPELQNHLVTSWTVDKEKLAHAVGPAVGAVETAAYYSGGFLYSKAFDNLPPVTQDVILATGDAAYNTMKGAWHYTGGEIVRGLTGFAELTQRALTAEWMAMKMGYHRDGFPGVADEMQDLFMGQQKFIGDWRQAWDDSEGKTLTTEIMRDMGMRPEDHPAMSFAGDFAIETLAMLGAGAVAKAARVVTIDPVLQEAFINTPLADETLMAASKFDTVGKLYTRLNPYWAEQPLLAREVAQVAPGDVQGVRDAIDAYKVLYPTKIDEATGLMQEGLRVDYLTDTNLQAVFNQVKSKLAQAAPDAFTTRFHKFFTATPVSNSGKMWMGGNNAKLLSDAIYSGGGNADDVAAAVDKLDAAGWTETAAAQIALDHEVQTFTDTAARITGRAVTGGVIDNSPLKILNRIESWTGRKNPELRARLAAAEGMNAPRTGLPAQPEKYLPEGSPAGGVSSGQLVRSQAKAMNENLYQGRLPLAETAFAGDTAPLVDSVFDTLAKLKNDIAKANAPIESKFAIPKSATPEIDVHVAAQKEVADAALKAAIGQELTPALSRVPQVTLGDAFGYGLLHDDHARLLGQLRDYVAALYQSGIDPATEPGFIKLLSNYVARSKVMDDLLTSRKRDDIISFASHFGQTDDEAQKLAKAIKSGRTVAQAVPEEAIALPYQLKHTRSSFLRDIYMYRDLGPARYFEAVQAASGIDPMMKFWRTAMLFGAGTQVKIALDDISRLLDQGIGLGAVRGWGKYNIGSRFGVKQPWQIKSEGKARDLLSLADPGGYRVVTDASHNATRAMYNRYYENLAGGSTGRLISDWQKLERDKTGSGLGFLHKQSTMLSRLTEPELHDMGVWGMAAIQQGTKRTPEQLKMLASNLDHHFRALALDDPSSVSAQIYYAAGQGKKMTRFDFRDLKKDGLPDIIGIEKWAEQGNFLKSGARKTAGGFTNLLFKPLDYLGGSVRGGVYNYFFTKRMEELLGGMADTISDVPHATFLKASSTARDYALGKVDEITYTFAKTPLEQALRNTIPFLSAYRDFWAYWGKALAERPTRLGLIANLQNMPEQTELSSILNPVARLFDPNLDDGTRQNINLKSALFFTGGLTGGLPSPGPVITVPLAALIKKKPEALGWLPELPGMTFTKPGTPFFGKLDKLYFALTGEHMPLGLGATDASTSKKEDDKLRLLLSDWQANNRGLQPSNKIVRDLAAQAARSVRQDTGFTFIGQYLDPAGLRMVPPEQQLSLARTIWLAAGTPADREMVRDFFMGKSQDLPDYIIQKYTNIKALPNDKMMGLFNHITGYYTAPTVSPPGTGIYTQSEILRMFPEIIPWIVGTTGKGRIDEVGSDITAAVARTGGSGVKDITQFANDILARYKDQNSYEIKLRNFAKYQQAEQALKDLAAGMGVAVKDLSANDVEQFTKKALLDKASPQYLEGQLPTASTAVANLKSDNYTAAAQEPNRIENLAASLGGYDISSLTGVTSNPNADAYKALAQAEETKRIVAMDKVIRGDPAKQTEEDRASVGLPTDPKTMQVINEIYYAETKNRDEMNAAGITSYTSKAGREYAAQLDASINVLAEKYGSTFVEQYSLIKGPEWSRVKAAGIGLYGPITNKEWAAAYGILGDMTNQMAAAKNTAAKDAAYQAAMTEIDRLKAGNEKFAKEFGLMFSGKTDLKPTAAQLRAYQGDLATNAPRAGRSYRGRRGGIKRGRARAKGISKGKSGGGVPRASKKKSKARAI